MKNFGFSFDYDEKSHMEVFSRAEARSSSCTERLHGKGREVRTIEEAAVIVRVRRWWGRWRDLVRCRACLEGTTDRTCWQIECEILEKERC